MRKIFFVYLPLIVTFIAVVVAYSFVIVYAEDGSTFDADFVPRIKGSKPTTILDCGESGSGLIYMAYILVIFERECDTVHGSEVVNCISETEEVADKRALLFSRDICKINAGARSLLVSDIRTIKCPKNQ